MYRIFFSSQKLGEKCPEHMGNSGSKITVVLVVLKSCFVKGLEYLTVASGSTACGIRMLQD